MLLKKLATKLSLSLSLIFQISFHKRAIANVWKQAHVVPIFKGKGSKYIIDNYRSVSLISTTCKVMESFIYKNSTNYYDRNNILTDKQHGHINNSTTINLLESMDDITSFIDTRY